MLAATLRKRIVEELFARRVDRWITGAIAVLIFALGFLAGRWTSLTSHATPIVFQEAPGGSPAVASVEDLRALAQPSPASAGNTASVKPAETRAPAVPPPLSPGPRAQSPRPGSFVASAKGTKYYVPSCPEVRRIKEENKVWFDTAEEARQSGYEPSRCVQKR